MGYSGVLWHRHEIHAILGLLFCALEILGEDKKGKQKNPNKTPKRWWIFQRTVPHKKLRLHLLCAYKSLNSFHLFSLSKALWMVITREPGVSLTLFTLKQKEFDFTEGKTYITCSFIFLPRLTWLFQWRKMSHHHHPAEDFLQHPPLCTMATINILLAKKWSVNHYFINAFFTVLEKIMETGIKAGTWLSF